ncbi:patched domain-containing protein 3 [Eurytemora carolleeae]|uniref:patched domain-containing protein 3 n=1 Tax=Eurytemora carolleeae TaxID=1294199 RepID=UPI000C780E5C|nr:patched domain-containing protein 3 [Eurytemora carolleeae]|eukprot:XP_023324182.1 patched domain-containing protein 3-like [Eurytemora affinis]
MTVLPKVGNDIFNKEIWTEASRLVQAIAKIQVMHDETLYTWETLCARFNGVCIDNSFLELKDVLGSVNLTYPLMKSLENNKTYPLVAHIGGTVVQNGILIRGSALKLTFILDRATPRRTKAGEIWTEVAKMYANSIQFIHIKVYAITDQSIQRELSLNIDSVVDKVPITVILVLAFSVYNCLSTDWVRSKPFMGVLGLAVSILSGLSAYGLALYCGLKWQAINLVSIFLLIGIGVDDTFVMLSSWWRTEGNDVVTRMSLTYQDAAVSITITSITNIISFLIGALMPGFPCVEIFCWYTGLGLLFIYFWTLTIFGGFLTLAGRLELANRHCVLFIKVRMGPGKSQAKRHGQP